MENKIKEMEYENTKAQEQLQRSATIQSQELEHLRHDKELFNMETEVCVCVVIIYLFYVCDMFFKVLRKSVEDAFREKEEAAKELKSITQQKAELEKQIEISKNEINGLNAKIQEGINLFYLILDWQ